MLIIFLLCLPGSLLVNVCLAAEAPASQEINRLDLEIFGNDVTKPLLSPEETFERLKRLAAIMESQSQTLATREEHLINLANNVKTLIDTRNKMMDQPCSAHNLYELRMVMNYFQRSNPLNVVPYLQSLALAHLNRCAKQVVEIAASTKLDPIAKQRVTSLVEIVHKTLGSSMMLKQSQDQQQHEAIKGDLAQVALQFLRSNNVISNESDKSESYFYQLFSENIMESCRSVGKALEEPIHVIRQCYMPEFLPSIDQQALKWAELLDTCDAITSKYFAAYQLYRSS